MSELAGVPKSHKLVEVYPDIDKLTLPGKTFHALIKREAFSEATAVSEEDLIADVYEGNSRGWSGSMSSTIARLRKILDDSSKNQYILVRVPSRNRKIPGKVYLKEEY